MRLRKTAEGVVLELHVKPNAKEFKIETTNDEWIISCRERPVKGRVNKELRKELSRLFKRRVEIVAGFRSRQKRVLIQDIDVNEVRRSVRSNEVAQ